MPRWIASDYRPKMIFPSILLALAIVYLYFSILNFMNSSDLFSILNLFGILILTVYLFGRAYGELYANKDYIDISTDGIEFRETPSTGHGWLPREQLLSFDNVESVDVVQIKNVFENEKSNFAIYLKVANKRPSIIGSKLTADQISRVGLALKGSVAISNTLQRFLGEEHQVKDVIDTAKNIWHSMTSKEDK